jgi:lactobin A/cerein 7B family class IIb bacteriocin
MNETLKLSEQFLPMEREEMHETNGGIWPAILAGLLIAGGVEIIGDWDNFKRGLSGRSEIK